jgi:integrase
MASVNRDQKGRWRVQFRTDAGRQTLWLGRQLQKTVVTEIGRNVDRIIDSRKHGVPLLPDSEKWLSRLPDELRKKLIRMGVIEDNGRQLPTTLGGFLDSYLKARTDLAAGTVSNLTVAKRWLEKYFGVDRELGSITAGEADLYRGWLSSEGGQAENTVRRLCSRAKQFFRAALRQRLITENPFGDMKKLAVGASSRARVFEITAAMAQQVLDTCPDAHWRLIFALSRYGGMRVPSEICLLEWQHIDWERGRILVNCKKTQHHRGREIREMPIFPELRPYLEAWRRACPKHREKVLRPMVNAKTNLRTGLLKILKRAGIKPWPKLFQNLRSTRAKELRRRFDPAVVAAWLGHTVDVADKHYCQVSDDDFRRAVEPPSSNGAA